MMKVRIRKLHPDAVVPWKSHDDDFCYDIVAVSCEEVAPFVYRYGTGLAFEIECEDEEFDLSDYNLAIDIRPRSSVWKTGLVLSNCEGTVDEGYRGEVSLVFYHVLPQMPIYKVGDRIGQLKLGVALPLEFVESDVLSETSRGAGGYGSTGS